MARCNSRRLRTQNPHNGNLKIEKGHKIHVLSEINNRWKSSMPSQAKIFLLTKPDQLGLFALVCFWSSPDMKQYTSGGMAGFICGASWYIASQYLEIGMLPEARALTLNVGFMQQCLNTPIEALADVCRREHKEFCNSILGGELTLFSLALQSINTPETMDTFLNKKCLNEDYQSLMRASALPSSRTEKMNYFDQISDDWKSSSLNNRKQNKALPSKISDGTTTQLKIIIEAVDTTDSGNTAIPIQHSFHIGCSTTLKGLFNNYAEERGISLRSLRFSYKSKILFLSSVANKTPQEMNMKDQDVIIAFDTSASAPQEPITQKVKKASGSKKSNAKKNCGPKKKKVDEGPSAKRKGINLEEYKARHSKMLTKLHEEVEPRLKEIRTSLNTLNLQRQAPKQKKKNKKKKTKNKSGNLDYQQALLPNSVGIGGKAGKPFYIIQVGEVENLYKTQKKRQPIHHHQSSSIDLHGYSKIEAYDTLNEHLPIWIDTANKKDTYPFVTEVKIVCGCGNQVLSEVVQEWISSSMSVRNAPKR